MCMLLMGCGSGGGFNPLSLNPTLLVLPENSFSDNGVTPAVDNDPTYFVDDATPNDNDLTQVTLANRPLYKSAGYWTFDGVNDVLASSSNINLAYPLTCICVARLKSLSGIDVISGMGSGSNIFYLCTIGYFVYAAVEDTLIGFGGPRIAFSDTTNFHIFIARFTSTTSRGIYIDGGTPVTESTSRVPTLTNMQCWVGGRVTANQPADADIAECIWIPTDSSVSINAYGNYLVAKYPSLSLSWTDI